MSEGRPRTEIKKALITSANPLFGRGLEKLLRGHAENHPIDIRLVGSMDETIDALANWRPDLVILDYDDREINRGQFLNIFVSEDRPMQVVLVSLQASGKTVVYDRRTLSSAQMEDWFDFFSSSVPEAQAEPKPTRKTNMKHFAIVSVLVVLSTALVYMLLTMTGILPVAASLQSEPIDRMFSLEFFFIAFFFSLITVILVYSMVVFRHKPGDDEEQEGRYVKGSSRLEVFWTIIPLGIVLGLSYLGSIALADTRRVDPQAMVVNVTAGQWYWIYEYPDYGFQSNSLYLPVNKQVLLKLTSKDVIHSFWVPEFRVKQDVLPGENLVKELRLTPTREGKYTVLCAELCGGAHAYMTSPVVVTTQQEFEAWAAQQAGVSGSPAAAADPAELGKQLANTNGCVGCHSVDGKPGVGPTWAGLFGSTTELADGSSMAVDENYLKTAILDPNAQVVNGFPPNLMPNTYKDTLSNEQTAAIIEYIKSLK